MISLNQIHSLMLCCNLCYRNCSIDRTKSQIGYCGQTDSITAARAALHYWEEPCISGQNGSGTVFFSGCSLRCVFCQNHTIALGQTGKSISLSRLSDIFLELQEKNAANINLVTPTHFIPQIAYALEKAKNMGLSIPIVYNTGSYETVEALHILDGLIDIYLPDLKYHSSTISQQYANASDYFVCATQAIHEMFRQVGTPVFDSVDETNSSSYADLSETSLLKRGLIVRHLILPDCLDDSRAILKYLYRTYQDSIFISIMNQYTPVNPPADFPNLHRKVSSSEYDSIISYAISLGIENAFIQEEDTASESFIPLFDYEGI